jgi:hypothetical protein
MRRSILRFFIIIILSIVFPSPILAKNYIQSLKNGTVDWSNGVVEAVGIGVPPAKPINSAQGRAMAERNAITQAQDHLREVLYHIPINSQTLIKDALSQSEIVSAQVEMLLREALIMDTDYSSDGSVKTTIVLTMRGPLAELLLPKAIRTIEPVQQPQGREQADEGAFTGLVVDCRGLPVRPVLAPRIVDEEGKEVYGPAYASRDYAVNQGMAAYTKDLNNNGRPYPRVASKPLAVKGIRTAGKDLSDIVISDADAAKIRGTASNVSFLHKCRVMIILE